ncbi:galactose-1-phosphate uridylyltransferase [Pelagibacteraceae bacterium]|nr:galactose-1-phosphate uridylyltransferase [Pelagibacteraceae bacterium]
MKKIYKRKFIKNDNRELLLFGYNEHKEDPGEQLDINDNLKPHMRWNPLRQEWVTYSASRKNRTSFPPSEYCPLCPGKNLNFPTEIPFKDFEIAVFQNRWSSFISTAENINFDNIFTKPSKGQCEVIVYSSQHNGSIAEIHQDKVELLINVWINRYEELYKNKDVKYIMPFENRGEECGVTLHHPHGQIYAYPFVPPVIEKELIAFEKENFLKVILDQFEEKYFVYKNDHFIALVPPFARYAYEVWIIPKRQVPGPWKFNSDEIKSLSIAIQKVVGGYDTFLNRRCPYVMGLHASPKLIDDKFHFHIEFYPPLRYGDKPKILAGSESLAGVFIMDVLPENSALELRKFMT